ncbi:MAG TPA: phenylalanine--tRNA ligase subunit beta [Gemmatimonadaceae bacterium]|nr:phenylalanine--tRNA ligase subunit beta [Gemmatimonadaceae bacterium]
MNLSYRWLRDFLPGLDLTPAALAERLTMRAATVEGLEPLRPDLAPIVVGRVVESARVPKSDKLTINKVDDGSGTLLDVICGAPNVRAGASYPFARAGTTLPGGLRIEKRKVMGHVSNGMLCSARELALGESHEGILELDTDAAPGTPLLDVLSRGDTRIVIDVLPNRPDLLSHRGVAREVAAALALPLLADPSDELVDGAGCRAPAAARDAREGKAGPIRVVLEDGEGAPRYLGVVISGVTVGPSPEWLRERVEAVGSRSINNIVDITNFMLHGFGQPMHAFDARRLGGSAVVVRRARAGETLVTLDGATRALDPEMTVIADGERAQAVAGVMGGRDSEVTDSTTDIFLEVAAFEPRRVRRTRRALGLATDASYRFERGVDVEACAELLGIAVRLLTAVAGGTVEGSPVDLYPAPAAPRELVLRPERVERILGTRVGREDIVALLESVGFTATGERELRVRAPSWRLDVEREIDLIEEVARLYGYERIPDELRPFRPGTVPDAPLHVTSRRVREALVAQGLLEARAMPFVRGAEHHYVRVANPLAENEAYLRRELLETLARRAEHNLAQMQRTIRLFEIGAAFEPGDGHLPREEMRVALLVLGDRHPPHWSEPHTPICDEWDVKWLAEVAARAAHPGATLELRPGTADVLWEIVVDGRAIGAARRVPLDAPVWAAPAFGVELSLGTLSATPVAPAGRSSYVGEARRDGAVSVTYRPLPTTPASGFDIALLVPNDMPAERVERSIVAASGPLLERLALLSEFRGGSVPEGFRSLAWQLTLRHPERTLESKEIAGRRERLLRTLEGELGVRIR